MTQEHGTPGDDRGVDPAAADADAGVGAGGLEIPGTEEGDAGDAVMPDGAEANEELGARTAGTPDRRHGGAGGGAGPGSDPPLGGQQR